MENLPELFEIFLIICLPELLIGKPKGTSLDGSKDCCTTYKKKEQKQLNYERGLSPPHAPPSDMLREQYPAQPC